MASSTGKTLNIIKSISNIADYDELVLSLRNMVMLLGMLLLWIPADYFLFVHEVHPTRWIYPEATTWLATEILRVRAYLIPIILSGLFLLYQYAPFIPDKRKTYLGWAGIEMTRARWAIGTFCVVIAYHFFAADVNLYANQVWYFDRFALLILAVLVYVNPVFAVPFTIYASNYNLHLTWPLGINGSSHFHYAEQFLLLFSMFVLLKVVVPYLRLWHVLVLVAAGQGATYYFSGYGKLTASAPTYFAWLYDNNTFYLTAGAYVAYDWWGMLPEQQMTGILRVLDHLDPLLNLFTITAEMAIIFAFFINRRISLALLALPILLHLGIFVFSGLLFRMWIFVLVVIIATIALQPSDSKTLRHMYQLPVGLFACWLMLTGSFLPRHTSYTWWDTGIYLNMDYLVTTTNGEQYPLHPSFLLPYDDLSRGSYHMYIDETLPDTNSIGAGSYNYWQHVQHAETPEQVLLPTFEHGYNGFDQNRQNALVTLLTTSLTHYQERGYDKSFMPFLPKIPPHYMTGYDPAVEYYAGQGPVEQLTISYRVDFYNRENHTFFRVTDDEVLSVALQP